MTRSPGRGALLLPAVTMGLHLLCASLWSLTVPPFETPDEPGHARYVNFLRQNHRLPLPGEEAPGEAHQPPLYYAAAALALAASGGEEIRLDLPRNPSFRWYGGPQENKYLHAAHQRPALSGSARSLHRLRLLSALLGAGAVGFIYLMGRRAGSSPPRAILPAALAAFLPQMTFVSGSLNNDPLANLLSAGSLALLTAAIGSRRPIRLLAWAGAFAGAGVLSKFTCLALLPCGPLAAWLAPRERRRETAAGATAFLAPALLIPAPLLIRNLLVLGDPLGASAQLATLPQLLDRKSLLSAYFVSEFPVVLFESFWGTFGWMSLRMPDAVYAGCLLVTLACLWGLIRMRRDGPTRRRHALWGIAVLLQVAQVVAYNLTFTQAQGRFLLPVLGPIAMLLVDGGRWWAPDRGREAEGSILRALIGIGLLAALNLSVLRLIVEPAYRQAAPLF